MCVPSAWASGFALLGLASSGFTLSAGSSNTNLRAVPKPPAPWRARSGSASAPASATYSPPISLGEIESSPGEIEISLGEILSSPGEIVSSPGEIVSSLLEVSISAAVSAASW